MSTFTKSAGFCPEANGKFWITTNPFEFREGNSEGITEVKVNKGFRTDFASVPFLIRWLVPARYVYNQAAVVHDHLYKYKTIRVIVLEKGRVMGYRARPEPATRKEADKIYYEAMLVLGRNKAVTWIMYKAVRMFGWLYF